jgi:hypothetical protein
VFKESNKIKKNKQEPKKKLKSNCSCSNDSDEDEEMANFVMKLKNETNKYKGKFPFKCFNYGKIGHIDDKCPYAKNKENDEEELPKKENKYKKRDKKRNKNKFFKKSFYSKEDSSSSNEVDDSDSDSKNALFLAYENDEEDYEEEDEVDLEVELIDALRKLKKERKKNNHSRKNYSSKKRSQISNSEEDQQMILKLKIKVEESKRIEEILRSQLEVKEKEKESLETKIVSLRKEIHKRDMQQNNIKILDEIISAQRSYHDRSGLGYNQTHIENASSYMIVEGEAEQRTYAEFTRGFTKKEECNPSYEND